VVRFVRHDGSRVVQATDPQGANVTLVKSKL
jgi:hypothetical protein